MKRGAGRTFERSRTREERVTIKDGSSSSPIVKLQCYNVIIPEDVVILIASVRGRALLKEEGRPVLVRNKNGVGAGASERVEKLVYVLLTIAGRVRRRGRLGGGGESERSLRSTFRCRGRKGIVDGVMKVPSPDDRGV